MNTLLIFLAFPIAVIIFSIVLEKLLKNPIIVASLIFAVFIILTFAVFGVNFLIATLAYTILSFITALIVHLLCNREEHEKMMLLITNLASSFTRFEAEYNDKYKILFDMTQDYIEHKSISALQLTSLEKNVKNNSFRISKLEKAI